jgi:adenylate cyclase
VIATFGVARPSPAYAADATAALDEALAEIDRWNAARHTAGLDPVVVNAALTIGPVIFGAVGDDMQLEYTVIGEPVNLAAKLDKHKEIRHTRAGDPGCVRDGARPGLSPKGPAADATRLPDRWHRCACRSCRARVILGDKGLADTVTDIRQSSRAGVL